MGEFGVTHVWFRCLRRNYWKIARNTTLETTVFFFFTVPNLIPNQQFPYFMLLL